MAQQLLSAVLQVAVFAAVPFLWWLFTARKRESFWFWIGFRKPVTDRSLSLALLLVVLASAAYAAASAALMGMLENEAATAASVFAGQGFTALPGILVYAVVQTSLSEEIFFRGFLGKRFAAKFGFTAGNSLQALCFGLLHGIPFGLATGSVTIMVLLTLLPGAIGWLIGWLNERKAGGSILPGWFLHALMNIAAGLLAAF